MWEIEKLCKEFPAGRRFQTWSTSQDRRPWQQGCAVQAVRNVSLGIRKGECLGLVGESGCGKTTLVHCLLRLIPSTSGQIRFEGRDFLSLSSPELRRSRQRIQVVFQDTFASLNPCMRVGRIVEEPLQIHRLGTAPGRRQRVKEVLIQVGLEPGLSRRYPSELSGGQRQRVGIARALATRPQFLAADEPFSSLDVPTSVRLVRLLERLRREYALTLLLVSHSLVLVRHLCHRIAVMHQGRIVEVAPSEEIFSGALHPWTRLLVRLGLPDGRSRGDELEGKERREPDRPAEGSASSNRQQPLREVSPDHFVEDF